MPGKTIPPITTEIVEKLKELEEEFQDGDLTEKGYWKKKCKLFDGYLPEDVSKIITGLEKGLKENIITEVREQVDN
ncbi:disco-interacting protein 2 homolog A-like [Saccostrea cucullata]|uniref:disco-interacting protein 2 homolog A-like n=1 Tax=Saccostrea cuccullata TaxID=36930 RepID=UPI002ED3C709